MPRFVPLVAAVIAGATLLPGPAHAAGEGTIVIQAGAVYFEAAPGAANNVTVWTEGPQWIFDDVQPIRPLAGCHFVGADPTRVTCDTNQFRKIVVRLFDGADTFTAGTDYSGKPVETFGGPGDDQLTPSLAVTSVMYGEDGADRLVGTDGSDILDGGDGNNQIEGRYGNDTLRAGDGVNFIDGGPGGDDFFTGAGSDVLAGGDGGDEFYGGGGDDFVNGGPGNDDITGGSGDDDITGGDGEDTISGSFGNDTIAGGEGNDRIWGSYGIDKVYGGPGDDMVAGSEGNDTVSGGAGSDEVRGDEGRDTCKTDDADWRVDSCEVRS